jgi:hypothetical protein
VTTLTKKTEYKTKKKAQLEATAAENKSEVIEWMKTQFLANAKAREILEDFYEGKENTGERE